MRIGVWKAIAGGGTAVAVVLDDEIMSSGIGAWVFLAIHVRYVRVSRMIELGENIRFLPYFLVIVFIFVVIVPIIWN
jgi:hypothetical protein